MKEKDAYVARRCLVVDKEVVVYPLVVGHSYLLAHGGRCGARYGTKQHLHFVFNTCCVDVAHNNDGLQVGSIPLAIEFAQQRWLEISYDFHRPNGETACILSPVQERSAQRVGQALAVVVTGAPFFLYNAAFFVDGFVFQSEVAGPVFDDVQCIEQHGAVVGIDILDVKLRVVK